METQKHRLWEALTDGRLFVSVLLLVMVSEWIGIRKIPVTAIISITLFPMLYSMILGLLVYLARLLKVEQSQRAERLIFLAILPLVTKLGMQIGPSLSKIVGMGAALMLQEFGHVGSILLAVPTGLALGLRKELIGLTHSIGREANVSLIAEKYGLDSPEGRGVMTVYVVGTLFGTLFYGFFVPVMALIPGIRVEAWAMASGMGSGSMMAAASGALSGVFPDRGSDIVLYAGASQVLTSATGLYMSIFLLLPLTRGVYRWLSRLCKDCEVEETDNGR
jgi:hypothetical protein